MVVVLFLGQTRCENCIKNARKQLKLELWFDRRTPSAKLMFQSLLSIHFPKSCPQRSKFLLRCPRETTQLCSVKLLAIFHAQAKYSLHTCSHRHCASKRDICIAGSSGPMNRIVRSPSFRGTKFSTASVFDEEQLRRRLLRAARDRAMRFCFSNLGIMSSTAITALRSITD